MEFLPPLISAYAEQHSSPETDLLKKISRETHLEVNMPRMLSGHLQGRFLSMISRLMQPNLIVEVGTYTGYSALCLAEGLAPHGRLITIDKNKELEQRVKNYFQQSPYGQQLEMICTDAAEFLPSLQGPVDLAFIDADKQNYALYFDLLLPKMRSGGLMIADNVLWSGKVVEQDSLVKDKDTQALHAFNEKVCKEEQIIPLLLPIRDGLMIMQKK